MNKSTYNQYHAFAIIGAELHNNTRSQVIACTHRTCPMYIIIPGHK